MIGLKPKIRAGVKMMEPRGLKKMMNVAKLVEDWSDADEETTEEDSNRGSRGNKSSQSRHKPNNPKSGPDQSNGPNSQKPKPNQQANSKESKPSGGHNRVKAPFRKLTEAEVAERKAKGLCFRCDEKFHRHHRCPKPELMVMMVQEDGTEIDVSNFNLEMEEDEEVEGVEVAEVSASSLAGISTSRTIKIVGTINGA